ncbi:SDR family NAD(P)-dependent oxidoreductase [Flavisphingomonas formosensis]|uniref:SDR family NAD(P)-dependent oxidoreductase n=1 Tax=Flavisphingomonas formosensis TaxID=861534 RepID=UPI0018DF7B08|nr:SDR family NAD(P)-dependent oxidoreductase [Sphingomonas formosensis]
MTAKEAFEGGVAVITGSGSGIGEGIARHAAALGMRVVLADIAEDRIARVAADIEADGGTAMPVPTDVTDAAALNRLAAIVQDRWGDVRLLINNAGIETMGYSWEVSAETWDRIIAINIAGVVHGVRAFLPRMLASGKRGYVANVSSVGGLGMMPTQTAYILTKHAVLSFCECLSLEMQAVDAPIHVSAILPGPVATRIFRDSPVGGARDFVEAQRAYMENMVQGGLTGLEAGRIILDGIAARQFWISTHPEVMAAMARDRGAHLSELQTPTLPDGVRAFLNQQYSEAGGLKGYRQ